MSKFKHRSFILVLALLFCISAIGPAVAGENVKSRMVGYATKWEQTEVGDHEGHVVAVLETMGVQTNLERKEFLDGWLTQIQGLFDINVKTGTGTAKGHEQIIDKEGDKILMTWEGKLHRKDGWDGVWVLVGGTGRFEGISGTGTWASFDVAPRLSYSDWEGEVELP